MFRYVQQYIGYDLESGVVTFHFYSVISESETDTRSTMCLFTAIWDVGCELQGDDVNGPHGGGE